MAGALALEHLNLSPVDTIDDIGTELRHYAEDKPAAPVAARPRTATPISSASANVPARKILDEAVQDRPVLVTSEDGPSPGPTRKRSSSPASIVRREIPVRGSL